MASNYRNFFSDDQFVILNELLRKLCGNSFSLRLSSGVTNSRNLLSTIVDAEIEWVKLRNVSISHFTIKVIPSSKPLLLLYPIETAYDREIYLYTKVFPEFEALQHEKAIDIPCRPYPVFYKTATQEMLVFENLRKLGFRHKSCQEPLDYNHMVIVIKEYARIHALSLALRDQKPKLFDEFIRNTREVFFKNFDYGGISEGTKHRIENALKSLDPVYDKHLYEKFSYYFKNSHSIMRKIMSEINQYSVICHFDTGISNLLFKYENESDIPTNVSIIDWQMSHLGSPAVDLSTFIYSASDKTLRNRYDELILEYYKTLSSFLKELGSDAESLLPFEILQKELKRYSLIGLFMAVQLVYIYTTKSEEFPNICNDDSYIYELQDRTEYDQRVRDAIIDYDKLGYNFW